MSFVISHLYREEESQRWVIQTNADHTEGVAKLASQFASEFGMATWGEMLGSLHDKGKESDAFQQHIKKVSGYEPDCIVRGDTHHAYVGGIMARQIYGQSADHFFVNQIVSHHTGLHDYDEIDTILKKEIPPEIDTHIRRNALDKPPFLAKSNDLHHFLLITIGQKSR